MDKLLEPGCYSLFIIIEDGMWVQPTYRITKAMTPREFENKVYDKHRKVIITCGLQEDDDCPEEHVEELK